MIILYHWALIRLNAMQARLSEDDWMSVYCLEHWMIIHKFINGDKSSFVLLKYLLCVLSFSWWIRFPRGSVHAPGETNVGKGVWGLQHVFVRLWPDWFWKIIQVDGSLYNERIGSFKFKSYTILLDDFIYYMAPEPCHMGQ